MIPNNVVVEQFLHHQPASSEHLSSDGKHLLSYNTCIAEWIDGKLIGNVTKYSKSTSQHQNMVKPYVYAVVYGVDEGESSIEKVYMHWRDVLGEDYEAS